MHLSKQANRDLRFMGSMYDARMIELCLDQIFTCQVDIRIMNMMHDHVQLRRLRF